MVELVSASTFHATDDLPDWRVILGRIEATYTAGSFGEAAALVGQIADAAEGNEACICTWQDSG